VFELGDEVFEGANDGCIGGCIGTFEDEVNIFENKDTGLVRGLADARDGTHDGVDIIVVVMPTGDQVPNIYLPEGFRNLCHLLK
jgi:hypothetical protein